MQKMLLRLYLVSWLPEKESKIIGFNRGAHCALYSLTKGDSMENILGVIGGMGPMASQLFYKIIIGKTDAAKDQEHINMMILSHATMPDRTDAILSGNTKQVYDMLLDDCQTLEDAGCKAIVIACNTAHYFAHQYTDKLNIPIISMIRETAKEVGHLYKGQLIAILATDATIETKLYQEALVQEGVVPYIVSAKSQKLIMHLIYDCVKNGKPSDQLALSHIEEELKSMGCSAALMACTELSVIKEDMALGTFYIDPMEVLAIKAIEFMGKKVKE